MTDVIEKAADVIKERLAELEEERKRLEKALSSLKGERRGPGRTRGPAGRSKSKAGARKSRKRAKRGEREAQLAASITANPNYKPADHAREIGVSPNQVYGLVTKMTKAGTVTKSKDGTLAVVASAEAQAPTG